MQIRALRRGDHGEERQYRDGAKVVFNTAYGGGFTNDVYSVSGNTNIEAHDNGFRDESETPVPVGTAL